MVVSDQAAAKKGGSMEALNGTIGKSTTVKKQESS